MREKPRILVAEDDFDLLTMIADALEFRGAEVVRAQTGSDLVLSLADEGPFDLVVTDISMPWMDGLRAMRSVRYAGLNVPVIFITGSSEAGLADEIAALGVGAVLLRKPVNLGDLESTVDELLRQAQSRS